MTGRTCGIAVGVGLLLAGTGCVSCGHEVCKTVIDAGPNCTVPRCDRSHVYVFLVNGVTPTGLDGLREELAGHGFDKVYCGHAVHGAWMALEMKRVRDGDPCARFVVVGYDLGCPTAVRLARGAARHGLPADAAVLLNPAGKTDMAGCAVPTVVVRCGTNSCAVPHTDRVLVAGATHFTLPSHPQTVDLLHCVLAESAYRVEHPSTYEPVEWRYENAPPPRPMIPPGPGEADEWFFLHEQPGPHAVPLTPVPCCPEVVPGPAVLPSPTPLPGSPLPLPVPRKLQQVP
jgi:hypothetical protein